MALYCKIDQGGEAKAPDSIRLFNGHELHVQDKVPHIVADYVLRVQADGHELERALKLTGKPMVNRVMRFYGDDAKFIVGNWNIDQGENDVQPVRAS